MAFLETALGVGKILGGLFGRKKSPTPADNIMSQARGAREAAEAYGFNPLTLLQYGQTAGAMGGGDTPPLASVEVILGGLEDLGQSLSGKAAQNKALNQFTNDRNSLRVDPYRRGLYARPASVTSTIGGTTSPLGGNTATHYPANGYDYGGYNGQGKDGSDTDGSGRLSSGPRLDDSGGVGVPDPLLDRGSGSFSYGRYVEPAPGFSPASVWEEEYGEVGAEIFGLQKLGVDLLYNAFPPAKIGPSRPDYTHEHWDKLKKQHEDRLAKKRADGVFSFPDHNQNPSYPSAWEMLPMYRY